MEANDKNDCVVEDLEVPGHVGELDGVAAGATCTTTCCCASAQCD